MKSIFFSCIFTCLLMSSACNQASKQGGLNFFNNFDARKGWADISMLTSDESYSGKWATFADSLHPFGFTFKLKFYEISKQPIRAVRFNVRCKVTKFPSRAVFIVGVNSPANQNIYYEVTPMNENLMHENKWVELTGLAEFKEPGINNPDNEMVFYLYNLDKEMVYADDYHLEFFK